MNKKPKAYKTKQEYSRYIGKNLYIVIEEGNIGKVTQKGVEFDNKAGGKLMMDLSFVLENPDIFEAVEEAN